MCQVRQSHEKHVCIFYNMFNPAHFFFLRRISIFTYFTYLLLPSGNGLGIRVVGGKEIPGSRGEIGAYVAKVIPGGAAEQTGKFVEGKGSSRGSVNDLLFWGFRIHLRDTKKICVCLKR